MSENGPREGTRDLPRPPPEAGGRAVEEDSPAGVAYATLSRSLRRRRAELAEMMESRGDAAIVASAYGSDHPFEPPVTVEEIRAAVAEMTPRTRSTTKAPDHRPAR